MSRHLLRKIYKNVISSEAASNSAAAMLMSRHLLNQIYKNVISSQAALSVTGAPSVKSPSVKVPPMWPFDQPPPPAAKAPPVPLQAKVPPPGPSRRAEERGARSGRQPQMIITCKATPPVPDDADRDRSVPLRTIVYWYGAPLAPILLRTIVYWHGVPRAPGFDFQ